MGKLLGIKPTDKEIKKYCEDIEELYKHGQTKESAVVPKFETLLSYCAKKVGWLLSSEYVISRIGKRPDGAFLDEFSYSQGIMEAKDDEDDLEKEVKNKFLIGYPRNNTIFWQPNRIIIYQNNKKVFDGQIGKISKDLVNKKVEHSLETRSNLAQALNTFFEFEPPHYEQWLEAVEAFKQAVPELSAGLLEKINQAKKDNKKFKDAFASFREICKQSINPNISDSAIEEMIIQHLLTERLLRKVFDLDRFTQDNTIARQLEEVIASLTSESFNRKEFLGRLDGFYKSIEAVAEDIEDFSEKQAFINAIYEKFFQGWAVKSADTLGIVYTPQPVVDFMVRSVGEILKAEFGKSLSSPNVHILDPFVGTGNFIVRVMKEIQPTDLSAKYRSELHCNEIALMPYYIASMNIEHEYWAVNKKYEPFTGICFADTFQMFEDSNYLGFAQAENSERVKKQREKPIFVVITNPPYNTQQANENDNNKNRKYAFLDKEISDTYAKDSKATLKNKLSDPYVKAIKWASKRIGDEGVVAVITNNSFIDNFAFDGMRKHLSQDFDKIYVLDLGGNVRKNPKLSGTTHNVFGIQVGVSINLLVKKNKEKQPHPSPLLKGEGDSVLPPPGEGGRRPDECVSSFPSHSGDSRSLPSPSGSPRSLPSPSGRGEGEGVFYARLDEYWRKEQKYEWLAKTGSVYSVAWKKLEPNGQNVWLTEGMSEDFDGFLPVGDKETKGNEDSKTIFTLFSAGVLTARDEWVYNFDKSKLVKNVELLLKTYNSEVDRWINARDKPKNNNEYYIDGFITNDETKIKWTDRLKTSLLSECLIVLNKSKIVKSMYRPFLRKYLYFDELLNQRRYQQHKIVNNMINNSNLVICFSGIGHDVFEVSISENISEYKFANPSNGGTQCFPFYTYNEDGTGKRENITDWSLEQFRNHYQTQPHPNPLLKGEGDNVLPPPGEGGRRPDEGVLSWPEYNKRQNLLSYATSMRKDSTDAEKVLWEMLRDRRFLNLKFRRQHVAGDFILDFYCKEKEFGVELDGGQHTEESNAEYDRRRSEILRKHGVKVVRFWNNDVLSKLESVMEALYVELADKQPHPNPLLKGEGDNVLPPLGEGGRRPDEGVLSWPEYNKRQNLLSYATSMRKDSTDAEKVLWEMLRDRRFLNLKFRRQHVAGDFILDFYCKEKEFGVELDGGQHTEESNAEYDRRRSEILKNHGVKVVRFWNNDVLNKLESVMEALYVELADKQPHPNPLLKGEGEDGAFLKGEGEITKWDIFHYVYAMLHHPGYRQEYKENLRRSLPRIPFAPDFWKFAKIGKQLADLHVNYEKIEPYPLERIENREAFADVQFKIKKMKLQADKTQLVYNEAITFTGIPKEVYDYKLGNRSALEWIVDQYQVTTDPRSGITQDPNDFDGDERYIFNLIGRIVAVSLETVKLTNELATLPYKENL